MDLDGLHGKKPFLCGKVCVRKIILATDHCVNRLQYLLAACASMEQVYEYIEIV